MFTKADDPKSKASGYAPSQALIRNKEKRAAIKTPPKPVEIKLVPELPASPVKMSHAEYLARPEISNSVLRHVGQSAAHAREWLKNPPEATQAMIFGSMAHSAILEPHLFKQNYVLSPKFDGRTNAGKQSKMDFANNNPGKIPLPEEQFEQILGMTESVYNHAGASELLELGESELSFFHDGLKCRPDHINGNIIIDLKTTEDASYKSFQKSIVNFGYADQAAFYIDVVKAATGHQIEQFILIAVEKKPPYAVATYALDELAIQHGRAMYQANLALWLECLKSGLYPAYSSEIQSMSLPGWAV